MSQSHFMLLSEKYNRLLDEYQNIYEQYLNTFHNKEMIEVKNFMFGGSSPIQTIDNISLSNCSNKCETNSSCSGATYSNDTCYLNSGKGMLIKANNSTAIVSQSLYYSTQLKHINRELTELNQEMFKLNSNNRENYLKTREKNNKYLHILNNNYYTLQKERDEIDKMINQHNSIDSAYENQSLYANSNYYSYILYLIAAIILIAIFLNLNVGTKQFGGGKRHTIPKFIFVLLAVIILFNSYIKNKL